MYHCNYFLTLYITINTCLKKKKKKKTIFKQILVSSPMILRVRGVTCPKIYELTPPHGTPLTPRPQELTPCANHHGTPALTDRFLDWFVIFLRDLVHFTSVRELFDLTPNVKERMAHLQIVFYQPKLSDVIPIVGTTYLISKNVIHDGFPHWHTEYIQVLR